MCHILYPSECPFVKLVTFGRGFKSILANSFSVTEHLEMSIRSRGLDRGLAPRLEGLTESRKELPACVAAELPAPRNHRLPGFCLGKLES